MLMVNKLLPEINIGIAGHVDHGKTTLTYAITGKWTMQHSEELKRGITIRLGYADSEVSKCEKCGKFVFGAKCKACNSAAITVRAFSVVDAPGHETLMAVMLAGAAIIDGAILVVAANEPVPQPQTAEHLMALKVLGIKKIIVVQNKVDTVVREAAIENYGQIKKFVTETLGADVPIIPISGQRGANLDLLAEAVQEFIPTPKRQEGDPMMLVARSFDINKPGAEITKLVGGVLGGAIVRGKFRVGDKIELKPGLKIEKKGGQVEWKPVITTITGISAGSQLVQEKGPGGSVAISTTLDPAISKADAFVGAVVGLPNKLPPVANAIDLQVSLFDYVIGTKEKLKIEPFKQYEPLMLNIGTATTVGIVQGAGKKMKLILKRPVVVQKGDKVAIARQVQSRWHLVGYGIVL
ncbi:MAG: translation initiation factor IF-2 subunit gamma [DPANN group archaeon]|nr:translation initiation factor IF-2 subunit gamma [DPANN group archaeon]